MSKNGKILKTFAILGATLCAPLLLSGCKKEEKKEEIMNFRVRDGWIQYSNDGDDWVNLFPSVSYTVKYEYGVSANLFKTAPYTLNLEGETWITALPQIKDEHADFFLGWFIKGTDKQIKNYDYVGGDITLEARFLFDDGSVAGLYQDGKFIDKWENLIIEGKIIVSNGKITAGNVDGYLRIDNSITSIGENAFTDCVGLKGVIIPESVTAVHVTAFNGCANLTTVIVDEDNTVYDSRNNCNAIISTSSNTLAVGCKNTIIPNTVTKIATKAFKNCSGLTSIIIPSSVMQIDREVFSNCSNLTEIICEDKPGYVWQVNMGAAWRDVQPDEILQLLKNGNQLIRVQK